MLRRVLILLLLVTVLAACGGDSDDDSSSDTDTDDGAVATEEVADDNVEEEAADAGDGTFVLSVSGDQSFEFEGNPVLGCVEDTMSLQTMTQSPKIFVILPSTVTPGTYPLADYDANADPNYVEGSAVVHITGEFGTGSSSNRGEFYFQDAAGELIIETVPAAPGEQFVASLSGELSDSDGESITFNTEFNFVSSSFNFMDCQFAEAG